MLGKAVLSTCMDISLDWSMCRLFFRTERSQQAGSTSSTTKVAMRAAGTHFTNFHATKSPLRSHIASFTNVCSWFQESNKTERNRTTIFTEEKRLRLTKRDSTREEHKRKQL